MKIACLRGGAIRPLMHGRPPASPVPCDTSRCHGRWGRKFAEKWRAFGAPGGSGCFDSCERSAAAKCHPLVVLLTRKCVSRAMQTCLIGRSKPRSSNFIPSLSSLSGFSDVSTPPLQMSVAALHNVLLRQVAKGGGTLPCRQFSGRASHHTYFLACPLTSRRGRLAGGSCASPPEQILLFSVPNDTARVLHHATLADRRRFAPPPRGSCFSARVGDSHKLSQVLVATGGSRPSGSTHGTPF